MRLSQAKPWTRHRNQNERARSVRTTGGKAKRHAPAERNAANRRLIETAVVESRLDLRDEPVQFPGRDEVEGDDPMALYEHVDGRT